MAADSKQKSLNNKKAVIDLCAYQILDTVSLAINAAILRGELKVKINIGIVDVESLDLAVKHILSKGYDLSRNTSSKGVVLNISWL